MSNLNNGGLTRVLNYIKTWVNGLLSGKSDTSHTHTKSQITDFPSIPSKTSDLTNDSGYLTSHQSLANYVTLNTAQTITATKTISANLNFSTTYTRGTTPSSSSLDKELIDYKDSAGNRIGLFESTVFSDKSSLNAIYAYNTSVASGGNIGYIGIGSKADGSVFTYAPTPAASDNSTQIATTAWVTSKGYITSSGSCNYANSAGAVAWDNVSGKPSTFTPSSHTHNYAGSSNAGGAASSTLKLETYKQGSTTETYGANYPIFAQWVDNNNVALKCTNYTVWVDKANSVAWGSVTGKPSFATVATSGSYNDLSNKPSIPSIDLRPQANADANTVSDGVSITHYGSNGPSTSLGAQANDGALFQQCWSSAWKVQIAADYRNGNLFTRGKNNGTWTAWRAVAYQNGTNGIAFGSYRVYVG